ncbi:MAG: STAS-like domain-containing protein [Terriglobales bacterium]
MSTIRERGEEARKYILENIEGHPADIGKVASEHLGITRQAINRHLHLLVQEGALTANGRTRSRVYGIRPLVEWFKRYRLGDGLEEDVVWRVDVEPLLGTLPENVADIWLYGFSEMFNNAKDHSAGSTISVFVTRTAAATEIAIIDNGVGIFRKIQAAFGLLDERHAILELSKGKLTTAPTGHTGEGVFFTSRLFDSFDIISGGLFYTHTFGEAEGWLAERAKPGDGTMVWLKLNNHTARSLAKIFRKFTSHEDDVSFSKTIVPVKQAQYGNEKLISRSQAKRLVARVEQFSTVIFDFKDVQYIGQAFADEVFRVFAQRHPSIRVLSINGSSEVKRMINRAKSVRVADAVSPESEDEPQ